MISEPYKILTAATEETYNYIINDILDRDNDVIGYKNIKSRPGGQTKKAIASEIYSFFLTHYYKAVDIYFVKKEISIDWISDNRLNIIDIGANIGTVTFAYIDILQKYNLARGISFNVIFIEPDKYRSKLLEKSIDKYIEKSGLNIQYRIISKFYQDSIKDVSTYLIQSDSILLMSNILNWVDQAWEEFKNSIIHNISLVNKEYECRAINIEATSPTNSHLRIEQLYNEITIKEIAKKYSSKKMPEFYNLKECFFYNQNRQVYKDKRKEYYYGFLIRYKQFSDIIHANYIDISYNKALYTCRNSFMYDNLEIKYVNANYDKVKEYIYELIKSGRRSESYGYQYRMKKSIDKTRPLYIDDFINDIISTSIIISEGLKADSVQDDDISYGNRVDDNMDSPFVFKLYYTQFFDKLKKKEEEYSKAFDYYYKIDLKQYYNHIEREKLKEILKQYEGLEKGWCKELIRMFVNDNLYDCEPNKGLAQGPDLSHLLANLYLNEFDKWFSKNFDNVKLLRYVDDMEILGKDRETCERVYKQCNEFLENTLSLKINTDKYEDGYTKDLIVKNEDVYFNEVGYLSNYILKSIYKLDKKNYNEFINNPEKFIDIYQKCLAKLGIYIPKEWLNIKIFKEIEFLRKMKKKITDDKKLLKWIHSKEIYDIRLNLGSIPDNGAEYIIEKWVKEFRSKNKEFIKKIESLKLLLHDKLNEILENVSLDQDKSKEYKSMFKFTMNKLRIFKCDNMNNYIQDIFKYFPYCNKKVFSTYDEVYGFVKEELRNENVDYNSYDYAISIWLLGEYKNKEALNMLEEIYMLSYEKEQYFINTLVTEAILKIKIIRNQFLSNLKNIVNNSDNYYCIRNAVLLINISDDKDKVLGEISKRNFDEERIVIFIDWIKNNIGCNVIDIVENIPECYKEYYPNYPIENEYISF